MRSDRFREGVAQLFPGLLGLWVALGPIKFGTPIILADQVLSPENWLEVIYQSWPLAWAYGSFVPVFVCGCLVWNWRTKAPRTVLLLPAAWIVWQLLSAGQSIRPDLTQKTIPHFLVCGAAFYLGVFALGQIPTDRWRTFWIGVAGGWLVVVLIGWKQHFGGLAEMREFFYSQPNWRDQPPELLLKIASNRIFSTLFYPNALAGVLLLLTPAVTAAIWSATSGSFTALLPRLLVSALPLVGAGACLIWSGSKAGWLIALGQWVLALAFAPMVARRARETPAVKNSGFSAAARGEVGATKAMDRPFAARFGWVALVVLVVAAGAGGFWWRYHSYFRKGATSVSARFDYWAIAGSNSLAQPLLGSGPGTFLEVYRRGKPPQAEMARLTHNDYLQQATDSGIPAALLFLALVGSTLWLGSPMRRDRTRHPIEFGIWLGVVGIVVQSLLEFGLYIPAIAWPWFLAMGSFVGFNSEDALRSRARKSAKK